jgi:23S rRNA pseudouridine2457 synthase
MENKKRYVAIYKPYRVLTQFSESEGKRTLKDILDLPKDMYPVGRLDHDSEGLLIITNDNFLKDKILSPKFGHKRTYFAQVEGIPTENDIKILEQGVEINFDGKKYLTKPAKCEIKKEPELPERIPPIRYRQSIPTTWLSITLTEGKNRQVRKMTAAIGFPTLRLVRYSLENLTLEIFGNKLHKYFNDTLISKEFSKSEIYKLLKIYTNN